MKKLKKPKITEVLPRIFSVVIQDDFQRAMTFLRVQEFYESPNPKFKRRDFNIWDYLEWYSSCKGGVFTYTKDWGGFNVPLPVAWECYEGREKSSKKGFNGVRSLPDDWKSKWDQSMDDIIWTIDARMFNKKNKRDNNAYIIGISEIGSETFNHEICHGLYYVNTEYREKANSLLCTIKKSHYKIFSKNLLRMGYTKSVLKDEIQAYLMYGHAVNDFGIGVKASIILDYNKAFRSSLDKFFKSK